MVFRVAQGRTARKFDDGHVDGAFEPRSGHLSAWSHSVRHNHPSVRGMRVEETTRAPGTFRCRYRYQDPGPHGLRHRLELKRGRVDHHPLEGVESSGERLGAMQQAEACSNGNRGRRGVILGFEPQSRPNPPLGIEVDETRGPLARGELRCEMKGNTRYTCAAAGARDHDRSSSSGRSGDLLDETNRVTIEDDRTGDRGPRIAHDHVGVCRRFPVEGQRPCRRRNI
ncbi:MAG: hypothetical protein QOG04_1044 [Actinomycetota bacterium]|nr:hypothetical protein [Actinomycetota bacterium]